MLFLIVQCLLSVCLVDNGMDVHELTMKGSRLTATDATALEAKLKDNPKDTDSRTMLLGYYFGARFSDREMEQSHQQHVLWLVENSPEAKVLGLPYGELDPIRGRQAFQKAKVFWLKHLEVQPKNLAILGHTSKFFSRRNPAKTKELLERAHGIAPKDPEWPQELGQHYAMQMMRLSGDERREAAGEALKQFELAYELSDKLGRDSILPRLGKVAFAAGEMEKAKAFAAAMLEPSDDKAEDWNRGNKTHHGNNLLGQIALAAGNIEEAKEHLIKAAKTSGSPQLGSFGPNMQLADELLKAGEKEVVLKCFDLCEKFWDMGEEKLNAWRTSVKDGNRNSARICITEIAANCSSHPDV